MKANAWTVDAMETNDAPAVTWNFGKACGNLAKMAEPANGERTDLRLADGAIGRTPLERDSLPPIADTARGGYRSVHDQRNYPFRRH